MKQQSFVVGLVAGAAAVLGGYRVLRSRHRIDLDRPHGRAHRRLAGARPGAGASVRRRRAPACACWRATRTSSGARGGSSRAERRHVGRDSACDIRSKADVERAIAEILERHSASMSWSTTPA